jgi:LysM repeat protein
LRQKIVDIPDNIGDFIASRNPALLAEPDSEIYQYASVLDYGGDHSLYGAPEAEITYGNAGDYVLYGRKSDYDDAKMSPIKTQTISDVSKDYGTLVVEEKKSFVLNTRKIKVEKGDTAYSIAKKNNMAVERLGILNKLPAPYNIKIGDELIVESAEIITTKTETTATNATAQKAGRPQAAQVAAAQPVIKSNANVKLPKLDARTNAKFSWPVRGNIIASFGPTRSGLHNDGINIAAKAGTPVAAAENGNVAYAGNEMKGYGNLLIIQHAGGWMTIYGHLDSFVVRRGDKVSVGQKIGSVGNTGKVGEPQLHFEIRKGSKAYDPKKQLK